MHIISQYLENEEKVVMATSKAEALEVEASGLRKIWLLLWTHTIPLKGKLRL